MASKIGAGFFSDNDKAANNIKSCKHNFGILTKENKRERANFRVNYKSVYDMLNSLV